MAEELNGASQCCRFQVFVNKVALHPVLKDSKELHQFLVASEHDWALEMARWTAETNAAKPPAVNGALQWLKSLQHSAQNMVSGRYGRRVCIACATSGTSGCPDDCCMHMVSGQMMPWKMRST